MDGMGWRIDVKAISRGCVGLVFLAGCVSPAWPGLAVRAASLQQMPPGAPAAACDAEPTPLGDYGFRVRCGASYVFLRCGYHHGSTCCWPVDTDEEATSLFAPSSHTKNGVVCDRL